MQGYGNILRIDLSSGNVSEQTIEPELAERFLGGVGINDWLLWEHFTAVDPRIDPLGPENVIIMGLGPLGGTATGLGSKMKFTFKGPLCNMFGDSVSGGSFGPMLRYAGYDHLVITGRAERPVYIWIDDGRVEIRDASSLWGKGVHEATETIRSELGDADVAVACIGQGGENLVRYASVTVTEERSAGRTGAGCVMGSKNLKAVAARGSKGVGVHDPAAFMEAVDDFYLRLRSDPSESDFRKNGTLRAVNFYDRIYGNAFRNGQYSKVPDQKVKLLKAEWFIDNLKTQDMACSVGCTVGCCHLCEIKGDESPAAARFAGERGDGPEYLTVASFGMGCDLPDMAAVTHLHHVCNDYGVDLVEMGGIISFLMELWERGIIDENDSQRWLGRPLSLEWGSLEAVEAVIRSIALQENDLGRLFQNGLLPAAQSITEDKDFPVEQYAVYGKGGITLPEEIRSYPIWAINFAVASRGCDHLKGYNVIDKAFRTDISEAWLGKPGAGVGYVPDLKGAASAHAENYTAAVNTLGVCVFRTARDPMNISLDVLAGAYRALTGLEISGGEMYTIGERVYNLEKAFNSRVGLRREDDRLCRRWMEEPVTGGPGKGMKAGDYFHELLDEYYLHKGWDVKTSLQTRRKLMELGLEDVVAVLEKEDAVV